MSAKQNAIYARQPFPSRFVCLVSSVSLSVWLLYATSPHPSILRWPQCRPSGGEDWVGGWVGGGATILLVALCNSSPLSSTHVNGGPRLSMLSVHVGRQMAGEGGRALGGREGGVAGLFPRRQGADPQRLGWAGSRREVRTHILQTRTTHTSQTCS